MDEYTNESVDMFLNEFQDGEAEDPKPAEPEQLGNEEEGEGVTSEQTPEDPKPDESEESDAPEEEQKPQTITIKYDGQQRELTLEEAVTLSQKGMNYDRMVWNYEERINNSREAQILDFFSQVYGKTREEYVEYLWQQRESAIAQQEAEKLQNEYPEAPAALIRKMSMERAKTRTQELERSATQRKQQGEEERLKPWYEFAEVYPEESKNISALPEKVLDAVKNGEHPVSAMRAYQLEQAQNELATLREQLEHAKKTEAQNQKNAKKAIGSVTSTREKPPEDPFLAAFFAE